jgi:hypothetical protein
MQDRIIRTCALENLGELSEVREVLEEELDRYNNHQIHSTTGEIPRIRFERALAEGNSLIRPFSLPEPYTSPDDVFCLREKRRINSYSRISLFGHDIQVPNTPLHKYVDIHLVPDPEKNSMDIRIWWNSAMVHSLTLPLLLCTNTSISIWSQIRKRTPWIFVFGGIALWFIHSPFLLKVLESTFEAK